MDVVRAGLNLIPFLLTVQSARPCTWELKKIFCYQVGAHQLEMIKREMDMEASINHLTNAGVIGHEKGTCSLTVFQKSHFHGK